MIRLASILPSQNGTGVGEWTTILVTYLGRYLPIFEHLEGTETAHDSWGVDRPKCRSRPFCRSPTLYLQARRPFRHQLKSKDHHQGLDKAVTLVSR